jgi:HK97 family phage major capsid protein
VYTADDKYTSGVRLVWTGESPATATVHRVTDPVFGTVNIPIHTAMASMPISNNLIEDSAFDIIGLSSDLMAEAFALGENDAFINGNGVMRPMGILTNVGGDGPAAVNSGTAATLLPDGLISLFGAVPSQYDRNSKWYMNKATEIVIRKMKDLDNNYLWPIWPQVGNFAATPRELLGYPVVRDEFIPDVGANTYPIIFGDLNGYLIVDRVGFAIQRLDELYAETNITLLLARKRVGGQTVEPYRIKAQKCSA